MSAKSCNVMPASNTDCASSSDSWLTLSNHCRGRWHVGFLGLLFRYFICQRKDDWTTPTDSRAAKTGITATKAHAGTCEIHSCIDESDATISNRRVSRRQTGSSSGKWVENFAPLNTTLRPIHNLSFLLSSPLIILIWTPFPFLAFSFSAKMLY